MTDVAQDRSEESHKLRSLLAVESVQPPGNILEYWQAFSQFSWVLERLLEEDRPLGQESNAALKHADGFDSVVLGHANLEILLDAQERCSLVAYSFL